jgi:hypothetical protein
MLINNLFISRSETSQAHEIICFNSRLEPSQAEQFSGTSTSTQFSGTSYMLINNLFNSRLEPSQAGQLPKTSQAHEIIFFNSRLEPTQAGQLSGTSNSHEKESF